MLIATAIALFLVGCVICVVHCCQPEAEKQPVKREPKPLLPPGCKLVGLANGNYRAVFPCGTSFPAGDEGANAAECIHVCNALFGEAKRRREIECEGR